MKHHSVHLNSRHFENKYGRHFSEACVVPFTWIVLTMKTYVFPSRVSWDHEDKAQWSSFVNHEVDDKHPPRIFQSKPPRSHVMEYFLTIKVRTLWFLVLSRFMWAKWHVRVSKKSCKQANRLILWGVGGAPQKKNSRFFYFFFSKQTWKIWFN